MDNVTNLRDTIAPKSDQMNADDLIAGPMTVAITKVTRGDSDQPIFIHLQGLQPYKPCKSMRRVLVAAWGDNGNDWVGRSMTLYCDPSVKFGGVQVGGIRISHLSDIAGNMALSLTTTRGKRSPYTVKPLHAIQDPAQQQPAQATELDLKPYGQALMDAQSMPDLIAAWTAAPPAARIQLEALKNQCKAALIAPPPPAFVEQPQQPAHDTMPPPAGGIEDF